MSASRSSRAARRGRVAGLRVIRVHAAGSFRAHEALVNVAVVQGHGVGNVDGHDALLIRSVSNNQTMAIDRGRQSNAGRIDEGAAGRCRYSGSVYTKPRQSLVGALQIGD